MSAAPTSQHLLAIETSTEAGSVALITNGAPAFDLHFHAHNSHSRVAAPAIEALLKLAGLQVRDLAAVAISAGPGSYTGLRIGTSLAKGLCFGAGVPLIAVSTLHALALQLQPTALALSATLLPMLDARRMEVYTAAYQSTMSELMAPQPLVVEGPASFEHLITGSPILYFGSGAAKCQPILQAKVDMLFIDGVVPSARTVGLVGWQRLQASQTENLTTFEPDYLKAFQGTRPVGFVAQNQPALR